MATITTLEDIQRMDQRIPISHRGTHCIYKPKELCETGYCKFCYNNPKAGGIRR